MSCLNCNRDTVGTAVFCDDCLNEMKKHPVEKGTPAIIPVQPSPTVQKKQNLELLGSMGETLSISRRTVRRMGRLIAVMALLLLLLGGLLAYILLVDIPDFLRDIHLPW